MARKKAAAAAAEPVDIRTAVEQWFVDAHAVVRLCRWLADFRNTQRTHSVRITDELEQEEHEHRIQTLFDDKRQAQQVLAETLLTHSEQLLVDLGSLQQRLQDAELYRLFKTAYAAIGDDFSHGSYAGGLFAWQVLQPFGYDMRRWTRELSDYWSYTGDGLDIELEQRYHEHCSRCPYEPGIDYAINKRLTLEHSQITRDLATIHGKQEPVAQVANQTAARQPPKPTRRKPAVPVEKTKEQIAFEYLLLWHRYDSDNFISDQIPSKDKWQLWMKDQARGSEVPSSATVSRMMKDKFRGQKKYETACRDGSIQQLLTIARGDAVRVYQGTGRERSTAAEQRELE